MPRYVLVHFDDNEKAKSFVERVNGDYIAVAGSNRGFFVRAVWAVPTKYCECTRGRDKMWPFTRGLRSGWWLHADCGRPTKAWATGVGWFAAIGRNILPGNTDLVPEGWGIARPEHPDLDHSHTPATH
jgi:hypothetical protein